MTKKLIVLFFLAATTVSPLYSAKKVVVVRSSSLPIYAQAINGIKKTVNSLSTPFDIIDITLPEGKSESDTVIANIQNQKPNAIISLGTSATRALRDKISDIPVIFCMVVDCKNNNLSGPGVTLDLKPSQHLNAIMKFFPQFKNIGILYSPAKSRDIAKEFQNLASQKGNVKISLEEIADIAQIENAVSSLAGKKADCLLMLPDPTIYTAQIGPQFILQTLRLGLAVVSFSPAYTKAGALASLYVDYEDNGAMAGEIASRILSGESPDNIPIFYPSKVVLALNLVVAERLKIQVSQETILAAAQVTK